MNLHLSLLVFSGDEALEIEHIVMDSPHNESLLSIYVVTGDNILATESTRI